MNLFEHLRNYFKESFSVNVADHIIYWTSERDFGQLLKEGKPIIVALTIPGCPPCDRMKHTLRYASKELEEQNVRILQVDCSQTNAKSFCLSRSPKGFPHVEVFHGIQENELTEDGKVRFKLQTIPFVGYDVSVYGLKTFLMKFGLLGDSTLKEQKR